jgi:hypothetical protein
MSAIKDDLSDALNYMLETPEEDDYLDFNDKLPPQPGEDGYEEYIQKRAEHHQEIKKRNQTEIDTAARKGNNFLGNKLYVVQNVGKYPYAVHTTIAITIDQVEGLGFNFARTPFPDAGVCIWQFASIDERIMFMDEFGGSVPFDLEGLLRRI